MRSTTIVVELNSHRQMVKDTDKGADLQQQIHDLETPLRVPQRVYQGKRAL
ncbi:MAG: hypothetical protein ACLRS8_10545 [Parabacteroides merdae]